MRAGWLVGGMIIALSVLAWSAWGDVHHWLVDNNAATPTHAGGYGQATVEFAQIAVQAQVPLTAALQERGLGGRTTLGEHAGMLFQYPEPSAYTFWMKGMKLPLDFIWIVDDQIADLTVDVQPPEPGQISLPVYRPRQPVTDILEVRAGFVAKYGLKVGDVVKIERR